MAIAEGATATNPQTGQKAVFKGGQWVVLGSPNMQQGANALSEADKGALTDMGKDLLQKQELARRANQFMALQKQGAGVATGPGYGDLHIPLIGDVGSPGQAVRTVLDAIGGKSDAERLKTLQGISNQTWVEMRPQGSGPIRGYEAEGFKQAFPNITNWGTSNQDITGRLNNEANDAATRLAFVNSFVNQGKGGVADALKAWGLRQTAPKATMPAQGPAMPKAGDVQGGYKFNGGDPSNPHSWSPVTQ